MVNVAPRGPTKFQTFPDPKVPPRDRVGHASHGSYGVYTCSYRVCAHACYMVYYVALLLEHCDVHSRRPNATPPPKKKLNQERTKYNLDLDKYLNLNWGKCARIPPPPTPPLLLSSVASSFWYWGGGGQRPRNVPTKNICTYIARASEASERLRNIYLHDSKYICIVIYNVSFL